MIRIHSSIRDYHLEFVNDIKKHICGLAQENACFVIDQKVHRLYPELFAALSKDQCFLVEATEQNKSFDFCRGLILRLLDCKVRKNTKLIACGGGIVQDVTSFCSSVLFRGIEWVFIPTTLLAQTDSCIGGKTSINVANYKNLIGNFYPPSQILIDLDFLKTLSKEDIKSGIGEILHFYFVAGEKRVAGMMEEYEHFFSDRSRLEKYILRSLEIKKRVIEIDEFDRGERNLFNYGHTFGHAIESISDYLVPHGQAVTLGMDLANFISVKRGLLKPDVFDQMRAHLEKNIPVYHFSVREMDSYLDALSRDKKNTDTQLSCILTQGPGQMMKKQIPMDQVLRENILEYFLKKEALR